jgi:class 3 adenylate cyclase
MKNLHAITGPQELDLLVAFFDLRRFLRYCQTHTEEDIVHMLSAYYEFVGDIIEEAGGTVVKFMGDAGLIAFPSDLINQGVQTLKHLKDASDKWLPEHDVRSEVIIKVHAGPVTCAQVGTRTNKQLDIFGMTVNTAALVESHGLAITPQVFRKLDSETRKLFKKHTPPVTYINVDEAHRR